MFLEGWNLDFLVGGVLEVTSTELKVFQKGLRIFGEIENFSSVGFESFSYWLNPFWVVENDVFLVDWNFFGGGMLIFFQRLKVFSGDSSYSQ